MRARELLQYLPLVDEEVKRILGRNHRAYGTGTGAKDRDRDHQKEELIAAGNYGLVLAGRAWRKKRLDGFGGFARIRIRGAMLDHLRWLDPLSRRKRRVLQRMQLAADRLECPIEQVNWHHHAKSIGVSLQETLGVLEWLQLEKTKNALR